MKKEILLKLDFDFECCNKIPVTTDRKVRYIK